ncbi:ANK1, partial [Symbiodinium pilosum]
MRRSDFEKKEKSFWLPCGQKALRSSKDVVLEAVGEYGPALEYASKELQGDQEVVLKAVRQDGTALEHASEDLLTDRDFLLQAVKQTKAWWLCRFADSELQEDEEFERQCKETAGTGIVFTYYDRYTCFEGMRLAFRTAGASVPGGEAYDMVMEELKHPLGEGSTATVWFGDEPVFGHAAADGAWVHPSHDCGRDEVSVPAMEERDAKWHSTVDSRSVSLEPQAGEKYKCWCCHWLREVRRHHEDGEAICCAISNIYREDWVLFHGAGSSELSDEDAEKHGLPKETFRNGRPDGWGKGQIRIDGHDFDRRAPVHPRTQKPLGVGCRWERQALDGMEFPVYAFFKP